MIDLHAHLLPGLDDGPASLAASVEMARAAHEAGSRTVACTPHLSERFPTEPAAVVEAVRVLGEALEAADVPLEVVPGAEIALPHLARLDDDDLRLASLDGQGRWLPL